MNHWKLEDNYIILLGRLRIIPNKVTNILDLSDAFRAYDFYLRKTR
jgi:hypothetical protein